MTPPEARSAYPPAPPLSTPERPIVIVGAGVLGASIAHHLSRDGHRVLVLDAGEVAGGATGASFAWVGLAKSPASAHEDPLRARAPAEFATMRAELGVALGRPGAGALTWEDTAERTRAFAREHRAAGHNVELLARERVLEREPGLLAAPELAALAPGDVGVDPVLLTRALLDGARSRGAEVRTGVRVTSLILDGGRVRGVRTAGGPIPASAVVLAAGVGLPALAATAGVRARVDASPCCLLRFESPRALVNGILSGPDYEVRQLDEHTLLAAEDVPEGFAGDPRALAAPTLRALREGLAGGEQIRLIDARIADRPVPPGGRALLGAAAGIEGLVLAAAHPGIILAGAIGGGVAQIFARR